MASEWIRLLEIWGYGSIGLICLGNVVAQLTFRQMTWRMHPPTNWRNTNFHSLWITRAEERNVLVKYRGLEPDSNLPLANRVAGISTISGLVSTLAWVITICALIVRLKVKTWQ